MAQLIHRVTVWHTVAAFNEAHPIWNGQNWRESENFLVHGPCRIGFWVEQQRDLVSWQVARDLGMRDQEVDGRFAHGSICEFAGNWNGRIDAYFGNVVGATYPFWVFVYLMNDNEDAVPTPTDEQRAA